MTKKKSPTTEIKLEYPVEFQGEVITALTLRRIKGKDLKKLDSRGEDMESSFLLFADLSEMAPDFFDEMDGADIEKVGEVVESFLPKAASAKKSKHSKTPSQT
jgi:hypothetical protein